MINQYPGVSVPSQVQNLVLSHVGMMDKYIIIPIGQNEFIGLIYDFLDHHVNQIRVYRSGTTYNNYYQVELTQGSWEYNVTHEYYVVSNVDLGVYVKPPVYDLVESMCITWVTVFLGLVILFKGIIFRWFGRSKR